MCTGSLINLRSNLPAFNYWLIYEVAAHYKAVPGFTLQACCYHSHTVPILLKPH